MKLDEALDRPEVVADVAAAFGRYEQALADGDVAVLTELFWDCLLYTSPSPRDRS